MKKQIIDGIIVIACVALCAAVWPWNAEVGDSPAEPVKTTVSADIEARSEETPHIFISADNPAPVAEAIAESEPPTTEITAEKETDKPAPTQTVQSVKPTSTSSEPHNGDVRVVNGEKQIYLLGFGWNKDEGGGNIGTTVGNPGDELTSNKVGSISGTVGSKGDIKKQVGVMGSGDAPVSSASAPGRKKYINDVLHVWAPGFGYVPHSGDNIVTYTDDMYESGVKIGIMGGDECPSIESDTQPPEQPETTGDVIYVPLQPPITKGSTPPAYKPNGEPYSP